MLKVSYGKIRQMFLKKCILWHCEAPLFLRVYRHLLLKWTTDTLSTISIRRVNGRVRKRVMRQLL